MQSLLLVQMSGVPGSGKSTIARAIAPHVDAVILDHDDTKSAILATGVENDLAGQASYSVIQALARRFLSEGRNVVIDSPCLYAPLLAFGLQAAADFDACYKYIECRLEDLDLLDSRLRQRHSRPSQLNRIGLTINHRGNPPRESRQLIREWAANMQRPDGDYLVLDSVQSIETCVGHALKYVLA